MASSRAEGIRSGLLGGEGLIGAAIILVFLYLALTQPILNDGDTSWHLATGKLILATRAVPHVDPFSFTFAGHAWTAHEWLAETLMALHDLQMPAIMLWPNVDAGSEDVSRGMRKFREQYRPEFIRFYKNFPVETFVRLMKSAACLVGNSSSFIREGAFIGAPAVNIGTRQAGRERGPNVMDVECDRHAIADAVRRQIAHGPYAPAHLYGDGTAGQQIAAVLARTPLHVQKRIQY